MKLWKYIRRITCHSENDPVFRAEIEEFSRRGLRVAGLVGIVLPTTMLGVYLLILGLTPSWRGEPGVSTAIWDELLISFSAAGLFLLSRSQVAIRNATKVFALFLWIATTVVLVDDLIHQGEIESTNYLALLMLVALGTVPCGFAAMFAMGAGMFAVYLVLVLIWPAPIRPSELIFFGTQAILAAWIAGMLFASRRSRFEAAHQTTLSEQKYRSLFRDASDAIFVIDSETGCFREVNPTLERLLGATAAELERIPFDRVVHPDDRERVVGYHAARLRGDPAPDRYQLRIVGPFSGQEHICDIAIHRSSDTGVTAGVVRDLTERVRAEETIRNYARELEAANKELHETRGRLVHAEKAAAMTDLVAGVVHELNSPLAVILSNAEVAQRATERIDPGSSDPAVSTNSELCRSIRILSEVCKGTKESANRISQLVATLKSFAHLDRSLIRSIDLNATISDAISLLRPFGKPETVITTNLAPLPAYLCVGRDISQLVATLVKRALITSPVGGRVNISTALQQDVIHLAVHDTGPVLSQEQSNRLFDPRFAVNDERVSLGLEFPIALQIVTAHGGSVDVTSDEVNGTKILVALPLKQFEK